MKTKKAGSSWTPPGFSVYRDGRKVSADFPLRFFQGPEEIGIFESLRTYQRPVIFREKQHLRRFLASAKTIGFPLFLNEAGLSRELHLALAAFSLERSRHKEPAADLFLRLSLWKNEVYVLVGQKRHASVLYERGVRLSTAPISRTHPNAQSPQVKTSAYHNAFMASLEIKPQDAYEWIFLDHSGFVTEVRIGNLFMVKNGILWTPPEEGILNGVTRGVVIECALRNRMKVRETPISRHDVYNASEAFLTNTSWEILPVCWVDGRKIGAGMPGPVTRRLRTTFKQIVQEECS